MAVRALVAAVVKQTVVPGILLLVVARYTIAAGVPRAAFGIHNAAGNGDAAGAADPG